MCSGSGAKVISGGGAERAGGQTEKGGDAVEQRSARAVGIEDRRTQRGGAGADAKSLDGARQDQLPDIARLSANSTIAAAFSSSAARITGRRPT